MRKEIVIPQNCPACNSVLEKVNAQLFCRNIKCSARTQKNMEHFAKTIGIKGLGPAAIKKLGIKHYYEIYSLSKEEIIECLSSEKLADKLFAEIERSKHADMPTVIASFGIPKVGKTAAQKLASVKALEALTKDECINLGLGNVTSTNLMDFIEHEYLLIKDKLPFKSLNKSDDISEELPVNSTKIRVCITGKLTSFKTKAEAKEQLELLGYIVTESVTKDVSILVDEENRGSAKRAKAEQLGLLIVDNLNNFIKEKNK